MKLELHFEGSGGNFGAHFGRFVGPNWGSLSEGSRREVGDGSGIGHQFRKVRGARLGTCVKSDLTLKGSWGDLGTRFGIHAEGFVVRGRNLFYRVPRGAKFGRGIL